MTNKSRKLFIVCLISVSLTYGFRIVQTMHHTEQQQKNISLTQWESASQVSSHSIIFIYSSHSRKCQQIFPLVWFFSQWKPIIFMNMVNVQNQQLAMRQGIKEIPTLVRGRRIYVGSQWGKILNFMIYN